MENTPQVNGTITPKKNVLFEVTTLSKTLAAIIFVVLPFIGGWIGYNYGKSATPSVTNNIIVETKLSEANNVPVNLVTEKEGVQIKNIIVTSQNEESFANPYLVMYNVTGLQAGQEVIGNMTSLSQPDGINGSLVKEVSGSATFTHSLDKLGNYRLRVTTIDGMELDTALLCMTPNEVCTDKADDVLLYTGPLFEVNDALVHFDRRNGGQYSNPYMGNDQLLIVADKNIEGSKLSGWSVKSALSGKHFFLKDLSQFKIGPYEWGVFIHTAKDPNYSDRAMEGEIHMYFNEPNMAWGIEHDTILLLDENETVVDAIIY